MREIIFYRTSTGYCPVEKFLDLLPFKHAKKVSWVLSLIEDLPMVPKQYFKKLVNTDDIWEVRVKSGGEAYRFLGFFDGSNLVVLDYAFQKKTQKPLKTQSKLLKNGKETISKGGQAMSDLQNYIAKRKVLDSNFAKDYDKGYKDFKIGVMLKIAREESGFTQEQLAQKLKTKKSAISRIENHAEDIKLSTLDRFAQALGKTLLVEVA